MMWEIRGIDPVVYTYTGPYLLSEEQGRLLAVSMLSHIHKGRKVVIDLDAGTHCIHHHFYYGLLNYCIVHENGDLFTPGSNLTIIEPTCSKPNTWLHVIEMYRKKGYIPDPLHLNTETPEEFIQRINIIKQ